MNIIHHREPFNHTIIYDFYTDGELESIWKTIVDLRMTNEIADLRDRRLMGIELKAEPLRSVSLNTLDYSRKIFDIQDQLLENPFAKYLSLINYYDTNVTYYKNDNGLQIHNDYVSILSIIIPLWKKPKAFEGGLLRFPKHVYTPDINSNDLILFPSFEYHELTKVIISEQDENLGLSRYAISQFMLILLESVSE